MPIQHSSQQDTPSPFPRRMAEVDAYEFISPSLLTPPGTPGSLFSPEPGDSPRQHDSPTGLRQLFHADSPRPSPLPRFGPFSPQVRVQERRPPRAQGIVGKTPFAKGEIIFREKPYLVIRSDWKYDEVSEAVSDLNFEDQSKFWDAKRSRKVDNIVDCIIQSNAVAIQLNEEDDSEATDEEEEEQVEDLGIFEFIAKLNHSCVPNCIWHWDMDLREMVLTAWRDIPQGEELTVCVYDDSAFLTWSHTRRNQSLAKWYDFPILPQLYSTSKERYCPCSACAYAPNRLEVSEQRLARYRGKLAFNWTKQELESDESQIARTTKWRRNLSKALADLREARLIVEKEQKWGELGGIWLQELQLWIQWGKVNEALEAAEEGSRWYHVSAGKSAAKEYFDPIVKLLREDPDGLDGWSDLADGSVEYILPAIRTSLPEVPVSNEHRKRKPKDHHDI